MFETLEFENYELGVEFPTDHFTLAALNLPLGTKLIELPLGNGIAKTSHIGKITQHDLITINDTVRNQLHGLSDAASSRADASLLSSEKTVNATAADPVPRSNSVAHNNQTRGGMRLLLVTLGASCLCVFGVFLFVRSLNRRRAPGK